MRNTTKQDSEVDPDVIREVSDGVSAIGMEITDISADTSVLSGVLQHQVELCEELSTSIRTLGKHNASITSSINDARERAVNTSAEIYQSQQTVDQSVKKISQFAQDVLQIEGQLGGIAKALGALNNITEGIEDITRRTHLLSLNAAIECARAGQAGVSFAVVANEMKQLARQVEEANQQISKSLEGLTGQVSTLAKQCKSSAEQAVGVQEDSNLIRGIIERVGQSVELIRGKSEEISGGSQTIESETASIEAHIGGFQKGIQQSAQALDSTAKRVQTLIGTSENLLQLAASSGARTSDCEMVELVREGAAKLQAMMEGCLEKGEITLSDLFDDKYEPISGTNPQQVRTRYLALTDRYFPEIQEPIAMASPLIVFCAAIDRNGYIPTHNVKFSKPQGNDPVWNAANSRNRRIFGDHVGLASGRNTKPFLIQLYRRDMGGGESVMMKDLSVPIMIKGKHWGNLRMGYKVER